MIVHLKKTKSILRRMRNSLTCKPHLHKKTGSLENFSSISCNSINLAGFMELTGQVDEICPLFHTARFTIIKNLFWIGFSGHFLIDTGHFRRKSYRGILSIHVNVLFLMSHFLKVYAVFLSGAHAYYVRKLQDLSLDYFTKSVQNNFGKKVGLVPSSLFLFSSISSNTVWQKQVNNNIQQSQWQGSGTCKDTCSLCYHTGFRSPAKCVLQKTSQKHWQLVNTHKH